ncbi:hydrogenase maturation nickel metallochaperone HypA [Shewanella schlegeliana]|uniref:Hydrogenase maturation factor HypA n=1 Tax=Shewanella schlegeliana TaxID=190308 RepID=A0ABS1SZ79_9GAMM|nr:hydrogenase maturation nickel metallochaperone HypA [Shewanella schlegeliana]MBL4913841.1 hydrogenase maturation nickel metallochaperone HypA [Shewanella schlegeliana]MCL1108775.1 hydrogenase maturation nickel metallochaperone HypA [Shewanella schlegeliana]GIU26081.1 putative hydrogenase nickel incorporation protein HypA [Shewanella schlegeliana]
MHEYSIVTALIEECERHAQANNAIKISRVEIKLGILSGVEPELLKTAFETFKLEGICREAELVMNIQPLILMCLDCGQSTEHSERSVICSHCQSGQTKVLDGEDMLLMQLELEQA